MSFAIGARGAEDSCQRAAAETRESFKTPTHHPIFEGVHAVKNWYVLCKAFSPGNEFRGSLQVPISVPASIARRDVGVRSEIYTCTR